METYNKDKMYDIMNITQSNYSNMLKRLNLSKSFSNFVITYYSIALIVYSLTAEYFPKIFDVKLSSYFNIILSIVVLTYSLIITNAKYSERIKAAEDVLNAVKAKKRELTDDNVNRMRVDYETIMSKAECRSELDFFRTLKQMCKSHGVCWYLYKKDFGKKINDAEERNLKNYLSENFPAIQQTKIICQYAGKLMIVLVPVILFGICFVTNNVVIF